MPAPWIPRARAGGRTGHRTPQVLCCGKCRTIPDSGTARAGEGIKAISDLFFRFELLEILSFDSVRRRMSVIVKSATGGNVFFLRVFELHVRRFYSRAYLCGTCGI